MLDAIKNSTDLGSAIIASLALIVATIGAYFSWIANNRAKEANRVAENATRDARNAPAEQVRRQLYQETEDVFTAITDSITTAWDETDTRPMCPVPDSFDTNLTELQRLHIKLPWESLRTHLDGAFDQLTYTRTCWDRLDQAENAPGHLQAQLELRGQFDPTQFASTLQEFHKTTTKARAAMSASKRTIDEMVEEIRPIFRSLIYDDKE